ncbi:hypothetical protein ACFQ1S_22090 [Kibdelosporangium lantanae]|uniref:Acyl-CoA thioesterase-like C-terminal domain-containing protein n=1 Tax=Kibdelosporangium lantanae TaxID=1497396 RepID=A0ABW3MEE6_9PSEU
MGPCELSSWTTGPETSVPPNAPSPGWVPTLQMSAYIRRLPAPGSVKVRMTGGDITGNRLDETALAWDGKDRLVAQAVQFAGVRMPRG